MWRGAEVSCLGELLGATSNILSEDKLAALEEEVAKLRLRVAELEEHSSGAATG